ncbi:hypothetical protein PMIT1320_00871 [Prochlorococcus marinus str. MIT 1320]|nr:hypothetical protein PMIT1320_00871 [Prochlorococcus marinus str. MIT 1320]
MSKISHPDQAKRWLLDKWFAFQGMDTPAVIVMGISFVLALVGLRELLKELKPAKPQKVH